MDILCQKHYWILENINLTPKLAQSAETSGAICSLNNMLKGYDVLHLWLYCLMYSGAIFCRIWNLAHRKIFNTTGSAGLPISRFIDPERFSIRWAGSFPAGVLPGLKDRDMQLLAMLAKFLTAQPGYCHSIDYTSSNHSSMEIINSEAVGCGLAFILDMLY